MLHQHAQFLTSPIIGCNQHRLQQEQCREFTINRLYSSIILLDPCLNLIVVQFNPIKMNVCFRQNYLKNSTEARNLKKHRGMRIQRQLFKSFIKSNETYNKYCKMRAISKKSTFYSCQKGSGRRQSSIPSRKVRSDLSDYEIRTFDANLVQTLGVGGFGTVKKAIHRLTGQPVAVKVCDISPGQQLAETIEREAQLQRSVLHSNITQVYEIIHHDEKVYIFMDFCKNGELFDRINRQGRLQERESARIFHQILSALSYLRTYGMSHRDIKPENILFDENWNAKLIDFGFSCDGQTKFRTTVCGTPSYSPPEIIKRQLYDPQLVDVWSLGVTLYAMLAGQLPFQGDTFQQRRKNILAFKYKQQPYFSPRTQKLFASIFADARYRARLSDLLQSEFLLFFGFPQSDYIDFRTENPEVEARVTSHIEHSLNIKAKFIEDSVRSCRLDRYRAIYYLTLKNIKQLTPFRKRKSSLMKLQPISQSPPLLKSKQFIIDHNQLLKLKTGGLKATQYPRERASTIFTHSKIRNRSDLPDSPRRLLDCLGAYKER